MNYFDLNSYIKNMKMKPKMEGDVRKMSNCPNYYTEEEFEQNFCVVEKEMDVCDSCPNLVYKDGLMSCSYFSNKKKENEN